MITPETEQAIRIVVMLMLVAWLTIMIGKAINFL